MIDVNLLPRSHGRNGEMQAQSPFLIHCIMRKTKVSVCGPSKQSQGAVMVNDVSTGWAAVPDMWDIILDGSVKVLLDEIISTDSARSRCPP